MREHATMATVRADGSPRISGTEVDFADDGDIYLGMMRGARRAADLRRDPRVAVHCPTGDPPEDDPSAWRGDGKIGARAVEVSDPHDLAAPHRFRLELTDVVLTKVAAGGQRLEISTWRPDGAVVVVHRG